VRPKTKRARKVRRKAKSKEDGAFLKGMTKVIDAATGSKRFKGN